MRERESDRHGGVREKESEMKVIWCAVSDGWWL